MVPIRSFSSLDFSELNDRSGKASAISPMDLFCAINSLRRLISSSEYRGPLRPRFHVLFNVQALINNRGRDVLKEKTLGEVNARTQTCHCIASSRLDSVCH